MFIILTVVVRIQTFLLNGLKSRCVSNKSGK